MSDTPQDPNGAPGADQQPSLAVLVQYLKDLSFENPRAPESFKGDAQPKIEVNVDVQGRALGPDQFEVELSVAARANSNGEPVFVVEAAYAGVFQIRNVPKEQLEPIMLVECPRLLFPFLRQIVADATRNGNFPPLMMEPIDFMAIYQANAERVRRQTAEAQSAAVEGPTA